MELGLTNAEQRPGWGIKTFWRYIPKTFPLLDAHSWNYVSCSKQDIERFESKMRTRKLSSPITPHRQELLERYIEGLKWVASSTSSLYFRSRGLLPPRWPRTGTLQSWIWTRPWAAPCPMPMVRLWTTLFVTFHRWKSWKGIGHPGKVFENK